MNQLANCLPRLGNQKDNIKLPKLYVYQITSQLKARSDTLIQLCTATKEDDELILLKQHDYKQVVQLHKRSTTWDTGVLDVPRRTNNWRWTGTERYSNCHS